MYYTVCHLTGILYAVVRQISMLFIDNKISVFCILYNYRPATRRFQHSLGSFQGTVAVLIVFCRTVNDLESV